MATSFRIELRGEGEVRIISLQGYLDAHTAPQFEKAIEDEFEAGRKKIVVDCAKLDYISSAGLGVFMSFIEEIRESGGDIRLAAIVPKVYQVFDVLGFPALFQIFEQTPAAVASFGERA